MSDVVWVKILRIFNLLLNRKLVQTYIFKLNVAGVVKVDLFLLLHCTLDNSFVCLVSKQIYNAVPFTLTYNSSAMKVTSMSIQIEYEIEYPPPSIYP